MIVVDAAVLAYLLIPGERTDEAERLRRNDPWWVAPTLARSELRDVLATLMRSGRMELDVALSVAATADDLLHRRTYVVPSASVLRCASTSGLTAYDCEYVVLAQELGVTLVTTDNEILSRFSDTARPL